MSKVMDMPARWAEVSQRIRSSRSGTEAENVPRTVSGGLNLKGRLSGSPEVYARLQRQPFGE